MKKFYEFILAVISVTCMGIAPYVSADNLLNDTNGDGVVRILAFGDSLTYGIGDGGLGVELGKRGYPSRLSSLVGVPVENIGVPGEEFSTAGVTRWVSAISNSNADLVILIEGANDAYNSVSTQTVSNAFQRAVNAAAVLGKKVILATLPTPTGDHIAQSLATNHYSNELHVLSGVNELPLIDLKKAWETTCSNAGACELYNLPEGLHPNANGYKVIAQTIAASLVGVDLFQPGGASELESALGLPAGTVIVKPGVTSTN